MAKWVVFYLTLGLLFSGCPFGGAKFADGHQANKIVLQNEATLSKEIFILIGRGFCCSGHIISVDKKGQVKYLVGAYPIPDDALKMPRMPENYDPQLIKLDTAYKPKEMKLSQEKIKMLEQLIVSEKDLRFVEDLPPIDDYIYNVYLGNRKIASGAQSRMNNFPKNLKALIDLIHDEIEMYELPGMA